MLYNILYSIAGLILLLLFVGLIIKKDYSLVSEIVINKPKQEVFEYVVQLKNQIYYNKWMMAEPNIRLTYKGIDATEGFTVSWKSNVRDVGEGEQEITHIEPSVSYHSELRFEKPFKGISQVYVTLEGISLDKTKVKTVFDTRTEFPLNLMIPLIKKMLQKDMDINAHNLKQILEAK